MRVMAARKKSSNWAMISTVTIQEEEEAGGKTVRRRAALVIRRWEFMVISWHGCGRFLLRRASIPAAACYAPRFLGQACAHRYHLRRTSAPP